MRMQRCCCCKKRHPPSPFAGWADSSPVPPTVEGNWWQNVLCLGMTPWWLLSTFLCVSVPTTLAWSYWYFRPLQNQYVLYAIAFIIAITLRALHPELLYSGISMKITWDDIATVPQARRMYIATMSILWVGICLVLTQYGFVTYFKQPHHELIKELGWIGGLLSLFSSVQAHTSKTLMVLVARHYKIRPGTAITHQASRTAWKDVMRTLRCSRSRERRRSSLARSEGETQSGIELAGLPVSPVGAARHTSR